MSHIRMGFIRVWFVLVMVAAACGSRAFGAEVDARELQSMRTAAVRDGVACAWVLMVSDFPETLGFNPSADTPEAVASRARRAKLLAELGPEIWTVGFNAVVGNMFSGYFTPKGLDILLASTHVRSLGNYCGWRLSSALPSMDGQLDAVEAELHRQKFVDAEITIDVVGLNLDLLKDGRVRYIETPGARQDFITKATGVLAALTPEQLLDGAAAQNKLALAANPNTPFDPRITVRLSHMGVVGIAPDRRVRRMVPSGFTVKHDRWVDPQMLEDARRYGEALVSITISYAFACHCSSKEAMRTDDESRARALNDILTQANLIGMVRVYDGGWADGTLSLAQLERLLAVKDDRLIQVRGHLMVSTTGGFGDPATVTTSTPTPPTPVPVIPILTSGIQVASDTIFDWAEQLPNSPVGVSSGASQSAHGYRFRYYPTTDSYLGISETNMPRLYYLGPASQAKAFDLGPMGEWLDLAAPIQTTQ